MEKDTEKSKEFTDTLLTAYLDFRGFTVKPKINPYKKISFIVSGDLLDNAIEDFYTNPKIPILSFCGSYKKIRSMLFNLREQR